MEWIKCSIIGTVVILLIGFIIIWSFMLATAITKGAEHISKYGLKSVVESVWEGTQDNSGSAPDSAQQIKPKSK